MLSKIILTNDLKAFLNRNVKQEDKEQSINDFASGLADIIDSYIRSQTIIVTGIVTAGSAITQTQTLPVTATIN